MSDTRSLQGLLDTLPQTGRVTWIGVRPARRQAMEVREQVEALPGNGLSGDRFRGRPGSKRQVTLIQEEHLAVIASCLNRTMIDPALVRRNLVVAGINLLALKGKRFEIGDAVLEFTGLCHPCSRMEEILGPGGYNAMRGHGGITAEVLDAGDIRLNDPVKVHHDT